MEQELDIRTDGGKQYREKALDWLTALVPVLLISLFYYRWRAAALELLAIGGYLAAEFLLARPCGRSHRAVRLPQAAMSGLLAAFCLPGETPFWPAALLGGLTAVWAELPTLISRRRPDSRLAYPLLHPVMAAFLLVRVAFPSAVTGYSVPVQWRGIDTIAAATPLAALTGATAAPAHWQLLYGIHAGTIGEICIPAIGLAFLYLLLRRRVRLIAPVAMLTTVSLLSLCFWRSPLYGLLAGSGALAALLLADRTYAPDKRGEQLLYGVIAGAVTVLIRRFGPWTEGTAAALLAAQGLSPLYPAALHGAATGGRWLGGRLRQWSGQLRQRIAGGKKKPKNAKMGVDKPPQGSV